MPATAGCLAAVHARRRQACRRPVTAAHPEPRAPLCSILFSARRPPYLDAVDAVSPELEEAGWSSPELAEAAHGLPLFPMTGTVQTVPCHLRPPSAPAPPPEILTRALRSPRSAPAVVSKPAVSKPHGLSLLRAARSPPLTVATSPSTAVPPHAAVAGASRRFPCPCHHLVRHGLNRAVPSRRRPPSPEPRRRCPAVITTAKLATILACLLRCRLFCLHHRAKLPCKSLSSSKLLCNVHCAVPLPFLCLCPCRALTVPSSPPSSPRSGYGDLRIRTMDVKWI